jgi:hypothetical protein
MAFERIIGAGSMIANPNLKNSWMSITSKIATKLALGQPIEWDSFEEEATSKILSFIMGEPRGRLELGLRWLYDIYVSDESLPEDKQRYEKNLLLLLHKTKERGDALDKVLGRLLMDTPELTKGALDFIRDCASQEDRAQMGFAILKDLIIQRQPYRQECLNILFDCVTHESKSL